MAHNKPLALLGHSWRPGLFASTDAAMSHGRPPGMEPHRPIGPWPTGAFSGTGGHRSQTRHLGDSTKTTALHGPETQHRGPLGTAEGQERSPPRHLPFCPTAQQTVPQRAGSRHRPWRPWGLCHDEARKQPPPTPKRTSPAACHPTSRAPKRGVHAISVRHKIIVFSSFPNHLKMPGDTLAQGSHKGRERAFPGQRLRAPQAPRNPQPPPAPEGGPSPSD